MPWYKTPDGHGMMHLNLGRAGNKKAPPPCSICGWIGERLCDFIVDPNILIHGKPKTCDARICSRCSFSPAPEKDICPKHEGLVKGWLAGRTNSCDGEGPNAY